MTHNARPTVLRSLETAGLLQRSYLEKLRAEEEEAERRRAEMAEMGDAHEWDTSAPRASSEGLPHLALLRLCDAGALIGSLTVELDVRPDELVGPLTHVVGGKARRLRVMDVVDGPPLKLTVFFEDHEETWELEDLYPFVLNVNDLLKDDPSARAVAILGEWEDALQLWCVEKKRLAWLLSQEWFFPRNRHQLQAISPP